MIVSLAVSLILTIIIEFVVVKVIHRKEKVLGAVILVNILTNPLVVYTYNMFCVFSVAYRDFILFILEILVVFVEAYVYKLLLNVSYKKAFVISFIANAIAYVTGLLLW